MFLDVNECKISNGDCEHNCRNKNGSYVCLCDDGFFLDGNGRTCSGKFCICNCLELPLKKVILNDLWNP